MKEIFWYFLELGWLAFGGPVGQIGILRATLKDRFTVVLALAAAALVLLGSAAARGEPVSFAVSTGQYGLRKEIPHALGIEMEVRPPWRWTLFRPVAGLLTTTGGTAFLYSGVAIEIPLPGGLRLTPGFAPGVVLARGDGDLGSRIEFRSSLELSMAPAGALRVGIGFSHISNAHLADHNPGVEVVTVKVAVPAGD